MTEHLQFQPPLKVFGCLSIKEKRSDNYLFINITSVTNLVNLVIQESHFTFQSERRKEIELDDNYLGQASIPVLNRTGYSMYWLSSWDSLHAYSRYFNEDIFLRNFFDDMLHRKISTHFIYWKSKTNEAEQYDFFLKRYKIYLKHSVNFKQIPKFLRRFYKIPYYWSKVKVLRFQKWLIVYFSIFSTNKPIIRSTVVRKKLYKNFIKFSKIIMRNSFLSDSFYNFD